MHIYNNTRTRKSELSSSSLKGLKLKTVPEGKSGLFLHGKVFKFPVLPNKI